MKPVLISFSGIDGAGKSTQIEMLRQYLTDAGISVSQFTFWDNVAAFPRLRAGFSRRVLRSDGSAGTPQRPARRRDKNVQSWPLIVCRAALYLLDLVNLFRIAHRAKSANSGVVIFDRYIYDHLAALPMEAWPVRAYAKLLIRLAPRPDIAYLLDAVPETARARKPEYPLEFMHKNRACFLRLRDVAGLQLILPGETEDVHAAIVERWTQSLLAKPRSSEVSSVVVA